MKRKIAIIIGVIILAFSFAGCGAEEVFCGWLDDPEALSVKINRMNLNEVHNLLGEPRAKLAGSESEVYLDSDENGVIIHYDEDKTVTSVEKEYSEVDKKFTVETYTRYEIMNKIIGRTKEEICERYGKFDSTSKDVTVSRYKDFNGVKVSIYFNENAVAEKVAIKAKGRSQNASDEENSPDEAGNDSVKLLNDVTALREKIMGMSLWDFLDLFGDPKGIMEAEDCRVYFDSNKNCIFVYFNQSRQVCQVEKVNLEDVKGKDYYLLPDEELITALMNDFIGKNKDEMLESCGDIKYILTTSNAYGYQNMFGKRVDVYYDRNDIVESVAINIEVDDTLNSDIDELREKLIGLTTIDTHMLFGRYQGWIMSENCFSYLDNKGNGIFIYYNKNNVIYKVEKIDCNEVKIKGFETNAEKMTLLMAKFMGKSEDDVIEKYGKPDVKFPELWGGSYNNIDGVELRVYYGDDGNVISINMK